MAFRDRASQALAVPTDHSHLCLSSFCFLGQMGYKGAKLTQARYKRVRE